jgi:four helix bundle protein
VTAKNYLEVEDLEVYKRLCRLHIEVCDLTHTWPKEEKYELGSQARRSSNSAPAQLAEKNDDRHIRNKIEGVNRSRAEAGETIHHLFMAKLKGYISEEIYLEFRRRYKECIRMLNGLEKTLERKVPKQEQRWQILEEPAVFGSNNETLPHGWPADTK